MEHLGSESQKPRKKRGFTETFITEEGHEGAADRRDKVIAKMDSKGIPGFRDFPPSEFVDDAKKVAAPAILGAGLALGAAQASQAQSLPAFDKAALTKLMQGEPIPRPRQEKVEYFSEEAIKCIVDNIYHEARGEKEDGWRGVMLVMFGRQLSKGYPKETCGVVHQKKQFSWTFDKKVLAQPINPRSYLRIQKFVQDELKGQDISTAATMLSMKLGLPTDTLFYKVKGFQGSPKVQEFFATLTPVKTIGRHEFFTSPAKKLRKR